MGFEHKEGMGSLFKNDHREEGDKRPNYKGQVNVGGKVYDIAAWLREGNKGKYMSLKVSEPRQAGGGQRREEPARRARWTPSRSRFNSNPRRDGKSRLGNLRRLTPPQHSEEQR
jgi:hypothetical protein